MVLCAMPGRARLAATVYATWLARLWTHGRNNAQMHKFSRLYDRLAGPGHVMPILVVVRRLHNCQRMIWKTNDLPAWAGVAIIVMSRLRQWLASHQAQLRRQDWMLMTQMMEFCRCNGYVCQQSLDTSQLFLLVLACTTFILFTTTVARNKIINVWNTEQLN